jgi:hypothetical protein
MSANKSSQSIPADPSQVSQCQPSQSVDAILVDAILVHAILALLFNC